MFPFANFSSAKSNENEHFAFCKQKKKIGKASNSCMRLTKEFNYKMDNGEKNHKIEVKLWKVNRPSDDLSF